MQEKVIQSLNNLIFGIIDGIWVEKPCKIIKVHSQYLVDIEYFDEGKTDVLFNVPVKNFQTKNAYFHLKINVGDRGTVRFLDENLLNYLKSSEKFPEKIYQNHAVQNGLFVLGFCPENEEYEFGDGEISIGTKSGSLITINNNEITIRGGNIILDGTTVIEGKSFLNHTHSNGNNGSPTGGVL